MPTCRCTQRGRISTARRRCSAAAPPAAPSRPPTPRGWRRASGRCSSCAAGRAGSGVGLALGQRGREPGTARVVAPPQFAPGSASVSSPRRAGPPPPRGLGRAGEQRRGDRADAAQHRTAHQDGRWIQGRTTSSPCRRSPGRPGKRMPPPAASPASRASPAGSRRWCPRWRSPAKSTSTSPKPTEEAKE